MDNEKSGFLLINKPSGPTSHDIVNQLRRVTGIKKIGHAGTLDPFASGLLIMAVGREATREISHFVKLDKMYIATLRLGAVTDTFDREGTIKTSNVECRMSNAKLEKILRQFIGKQKQIPPMYSAKKIGGKKLYQLARRGITIEREPVDIEIYDIELAGYDWPMLKIKTRVSSGTYIRALARDIGLALGCGAYLHALERTAIGGYSILDASGLDALKEDNWQKKLFV